MTCHICSMMIKAKRHRLQVQSVMAVIQRYHTKRLYQLLLGNDLKHVPVTSDGNCFYTTFLKSVMMETDIQRLRKNAWDYMSSNSKRHIEFCAANNYIREEHNLQDAESLKASDIRNVSLGDCVPLALGCAIRIYSSDIRTPVYDIISSTKITGKKVNQRKV